MVTIYQELQMYKNFDELASDVLDLAKEILPDQLFFLSSVSDTQQVILKLSNEDTSILVAEGMVVNLNDTLCNRIDFEKKQPLIYEDTMKESSLADFKNALEEANVRSYLGIPISFMNGEKFGTLCAINDEVSHFDNKSIHLLQRIVRMFSYYLDLERFAYRDSLTDLYNRRYLSTFFEDHHKTGGVIFFLDLDGFKKVNDVHGHDEGDLVLKEVAWRLRKFVNEHRNAFAVRLGGDEFIIHFSDISSKEEMTKQAERLLDSLSAWDADYQLSASIGIVTYPIDDTINLNMLLKHADHALYRAKTAGKNTYKFFDS
ncbi:GAF sensor-containing diguanylate cyclase [Planococcus antarcticus DSM 14505]|uniref:GAF sensor-containing diguanylate cyclase n=1 Tax=Planococcus antarcticus DSM 14505 TaxID=1185653 RepID=A0A1C7DLI6_9BACL|nr:sensor domain-containing diguanylate cyclase [Planococcus antarcticus]ANU12083.1 GGDEF domain-containing protein [Planococcus antarcticus DSM 14505]EIM08072.1 GAF sensor-containing diguanylate cyclase [Planococcus antarcticus DSM 14505]